MTVDDNKGGIAVRCDAELHHTYECSSPCSSISFQNGMCTCVHTLVIDINAYCIIEALPLTAPESAELSTLDLT